MPPVPRGTVRLLDAADFADASDGKLVFDTREPEGFAGSHVPGSHSVWLGGLPVSAAGRA